MFGLNLSDLDIIVAYIKDNPAIEEAIIFGSRAKGNNRKGSDIDIALKGQTLDSVVLKLSGELNDESPLPYQFDILDYHSLSNDDLKEHIDRVGKVIYSKRN